jgi:putative transposase
MHAALRAQGRVCSRGRIARLMRRHGIRALAGRHFRPRTTDSRHFLPVAPNLLAQRFVAAAPDRIWLADITDIATGGGWLYLAAILDLSTRKIVGWSMQNHLRTELTLAAPLMAAQRQRRWGTHDEARCDLFAYIEAHYNRQRIHSAIGYLTPEQAERKAG